MLKKINIHLKNTIITVMLLIIAMSCKKSSHPVKPTEVENKFNIFLLADTTLKMDDIVDSDLTKLKLNPEPWISAWDIDFYDWSSHCIYLKEEKTHFFPKLVNNFLFPSYLNKRPYIVTANSVPAYSGYILSIISSGLDGYNPFIDESSFLFFSEDILSSKFAYMFIDDMRNNLFVKQALIDDGIFHAGISVCLDETDPGSLMISDDSDTCLIEYTYIIKNNDVDDLYIFDPEKTGDGIYNAHNNSPVFINAVTGQNNDPVTRDVSFSGEWSINGWYTLLASGDSLKRTVQAGKYLPLDEGEYIFQLSYNAPTRYLDKVKRQRQNGRVWLGTVRMPVYAFTKKAGSRMNIYKIAGNSFNAGLAVKGKLPEIHRQALKNTDWKKK